MGLFSGKVNGIIPAETECCLYFSGITHDTYPGISANTDAALVSAARACIHIGGYQKENAAVGGISGKYFFSPISVLQ
jgi:hypothetical protein